MKRVGDQVSGFSAGFDENTGAVRVRGWGFWNADVAALFADTVKQASSESPTGVPLWMDMTDLKPLREEGQRSFGALIGSLSALGIGRVTVVTASHLTKLQLLRLVSEHGGSRVVEFTTADADVTRTITAVTTEGKAGAK